MDNELRRQLIAMGALILAGVVTLCATLLDHAGVSVVVVPVALIAAIALARPTWAMVGLVAVSLAVEMAVPLQTGGGRIGDWDLHYQLARAYAGLSSTVSLADLRQRTPLFDALGGGVLVWGHAYWAFQIVSVFLNSLWLWPAQLLLRSLGANPRGLVVVGLTPMVIFYSVYTWPWGFVSFFVLTAIWAALQRGRLAAITVGVALAGALVTHIGSVGLVAGVALWVVFRGTHWKHAFATGFVGVVAPMACWAAFTHTVSPSVLWAVSVPARYAGSLTQWLLSRPVVLASTFWGIPPLGLGTHLLDALISLFFFSTSAALLPVLLIGRRWPRPPQPATWAIIGGVVAGLLLLPTNTSRSGLAETVFTADTMLIIVAVSRLSDKQSRTLARITAAIAAVAVAALVWRSEILVPGDPNLAYKSTQDLEFFVTRFGIVPSVLLGAIGIIVLLRSWRQGVPRNRIWGGAGRDPSPGI
ncbi:MAG TPA: hypothetical protein VI434_15030 [Candidatus Dormibacteraeota bacterium]